MSKLKQWWNQIPSLFTLYNRALERSKNEKLTTILCIFTVAIWLILSAGVVSIFNSSYTLAGVGLIISCLMSLIFFILLARETFMHTDENGKSVVNKKPTYFIRTLAIISIILQIGFTVWSFIPTDQLKPTDNGLQPNTTYVTYDSTCDYCQAAHASLQKAVTRYNNTHGKPLQVVNIHDNTNLARDLVAHIKYKGSAVTYTHDGKFKSPMVYTIGNQNGPLTPSPNAVYQTIIKSQGQPIITTIGKGIEHQMHHTMDMMFNLSRPIGL